MDEGWPGGDVLGGDRPRTQGGTRPPPYGLGKLDELWPNRTMRAAYRAALETLQGDIGDLGTEQWPARLREALVALIRLRFPPGASIVDRAVRQALREVSALGSMLMHLRLAVSTHRPAILVNDRRSRTRYTTYPTSPRIGASIARFVWPALAQLSIPRGTAARILDPTMEGAPLLLEMAFEAARRARRGLAVASDPQGRPVTLCGIDQNPVAASFVRELFDRIGAQPGLDGLAFSATTGDALDVLEASGAVHAIVNNPPWGAATDGADTRNLTEFGPFNGYRDPYIAFVATGLRKLQPGAPFGFVVPFQLLTAANAGGLRQELLDNARLDVICQLPRSLFPRLTMRTVMILGRRARDGERRCGTLLVRYPMTRRIGDPSEPEHSRLRASELHRTGRQPWKLAARPEPDETLERSMRRLAEVATVFIGIEPYGVGRGRPKQTKAVLESRPFSFSSPGPGQTPVMRGRNVRRFCVTAPAEYVRVGPWLSAQGRQMEHLNEPRVFVREICGRDGHLVASPAPAGVIARRGILTIACRTIAPSILSALLNSAWAAGHVRTHCTGYYKESFGRISPDDLRGLPIPLFLANGAGDSEGAAIREALRQASSRAEQAAIAGDRAMRERAMASIDRMVAQAYAR